MQTTEKLHIPFQTEINHLADIQIKQCDMFKLSVNKQFQYFDKEYSAIKHKFSIENKLDLIKRVELVDFLFELNVHAYSLPKDFENAFNLLKIVVAKTALYHSALFINSHNPIAHYLQSAASHIKQKLNSKNQKACLKLLMVNIQTIITKYQSDPFFFDAEAKTIINTIKTAKALNNASNDTEETVLKTSSLRDRFTSSMTHNDDEINIKNNVFLLSAKNLKKGDWLNLEQNNTTILIKLIWKADDNSEFIFVNKDGVKERQCTLIELASDMENGVVSVMSNTSQALNRNNSVLKTIG